MISPAKSGRLVAFHFREVATQLPEVHFWALPSTSVTSRTLEVIEMFPDAAALCTFAVTMLTEHPDVLARLRNEVLETVGPNGKIGPESLKEMKYLRAVLDGKRFTLARGSSDLICCKNAEVVSKRVCLAIHPVLIF